MGLIPIIEGDYNKRDILEEQMVDFLRALSLTNHKRRDEVPYLLKAERPPEKVSGEIGLIWPAWRGPLESSGAVVQDVEDIMTKIKKEDTEEREERWRKGWNRFNETEEGEIAYSQYREEKWLGFETLLKYVTMAVVFVVVVTAGVVSKGATFFMVNQVAKESKQLAVCDKDFTMTYVYTEVAPVEKVGWLWAIFFSFVAPEFFTFFRNFRIFFMKHHSEYPQKREFFIILTFETLHVLGTSILFLLAFPSLDSMTAILASSAVEFFPTLLKPLNFFFGSMKSKVSLTLSVVSLFVQVVAVSFTFFVSSQTSEVHWSLGLGLLLVSFGWWESYIPENKGRFIWKSEKNIIDSSMGFLKAFPHTLFFV